MIPWVPMHHAGVPPSDYPPQYELRGVEETGLGFPRVISGLYVLKVAEKDSLVARKKVLWR